MVLKSQIPIMILVGISILALIVGVLTKELRSPEMTSTFRTAPEGFWYVFAVFFPAVTGFTAGIGMSGDLKTPRKSIPIGTIGAVVSGALIYMIIPIFLSVTAALTFEELADPNAGVSTWTRLAVFGGIAIYPAVWGAILSSAFGSILGGPRVLQALSMDGLAPKFLSKLSKSGQPTVATWISGAIALLAVSLGELNTVAKFVSVLFLTLYVAINLSAAIETLVAEPSYRPRIKVPWYISLLGALGAIVVMYLISPLACLLAFVLEGALLVYLFTKKMEQQWGDVAAGFWLKIARFALLRLGKRKVVSRNWRPLMLLFVQDINDRIQLVKLAAELGQNQGVLTISKLLFSDKIVDPPVRREMELEMKKDLKAHDLEAFCEVNVVPELHRGILNITKAHGIAGLKSNTVVFGWSEEESGKISQLKIIKDLCIAGKNILLVKLFNDIEEKLEYQEIDLWWGGKENNGDLMLLCAYLLKLNTTWEKARICIRSVVDTEAQQKALTEGIEALLPKARIKAEVRVLVKENNKDFSAILHRESKDADIVFLGLSIPEEGKELDAAAKIDEMSSGLKTMVYVKNSSMSHSVPILLKL